MPRSRRIGRPVTRFQRLAASTVVLTFVLVALGVAVRATDSGLACPTWPGCFEGRFLPDLGAGWQVWLEWTHRTVAAVLGFVILAMALVALLDHRDRRSIWVPSVVAVGLVGFQAWLGRETVRLGNTGESVTAHLAAAMALVGLLVYLLVRARFPLRIGGRGAPSHLRFTLVAALAAAATFIVMLFGSNVTALNAALVFPDWPLMNGSLVPPLSGEVASAHILHRWVAGAVLVLVLGVAVAARRLGASGWLGTVAWLAAGLYVVQVLVGGLQVLTKLAAWTQTLHVALGALIWGALVALAVGSWYSARLASSASADPSSEAARPSTGDTARAYIALMKPRIIELLLVTTIPAMVLATRDVPGMPPLRWTWLAFWTLVCGTLAAGAANAINQVLERDIDARMARTRRRPLPTAQIEPAQALAFGLVLGAVSVALMAATVNLVAAFLTLLAIAFYVVVYTMLLKRSTPQNIVIGGAAGALPPVIGWAAVTGSIALPALMLFLIVFYWTPPHFWALSLRIRSDYAAAGVPMLPVVRGVGETTRQIGLYTILLVVLSLVFAVVAGMGPVYASAAIVLGGLFLWRAYQLWRDGTSPDQAVVESTTQAIRLYRFSISYLALLFAAVAVDALIAF